ncbi:hypothetical protein BDR04DRAFT_1142542 [Suillus decipiens]|nr:hypothetical protein BDR04DRAFT_1142542 [Suillus decipiens]
MTQSAPYPSPQHPSVPPLYHQPFPSSALPGDVIPYAPPAPHKGYLHQYREPGLATGSASSSLPQAPSFSVGQKRIAGGSRDHDVKQTKTSCNGIKNDPLFKPVLNRCGQPDGTFKCSKDGMILHPASYLKHINTQKHLGFKLEKFKCPGCFKSYTRRDTCRRHWDNSCGKLAPEGSRLSYSAACQASMSFDSAPAEVDDSLAANQIQNLDLVTPVLPPSETREITLAEVQGDIDFWRWINEKEDFVDPVLPISEPPSYRLPETILAVADEDPDVWGLVTKIENLVDPKLPLCKSPTDLAEDPGFCQFPIRTLLISCWLHQRSPFELAPLSSASIDHEIEL